MADPYLYPGTAVLRNKENIRDAEELKRFERLMTAQRCREALPQIEITPDGYREIHRYIFQDVYDWAGQDRTVDIAGHGTFFLSVELVAAALQKRFAKIKTENNLRGLGPEQFAARAAEHVCELNAIHPFREGNGRTLRAFLDVLATQAGHQLDPTRIDPQAWNKASREADYMQDYRPMRTVIASALIERVEREVTGDRRTVYEKTEEAYARYEAEKANDPNRPKDRDR